MASSQTRQTPYTDRFSSLPFETLSSEQKQGYPNTSLSAAATAALWAQVSAG